jgi:hypothetical protein
VGVKMKKNNSLGYITRLSMTRKYKRGRKNAGSDEKGGIEGELRPKTKHGFF